MLPCQGRCREFEPRLPLHLNKEPSGLFLMQIFEDEASLLSLILAICNRYCSTTSQYCLISGLIYAFKYSITSLTWPLTFTLRHSLIIFKFSSSTKVERSIPIYFLPYIDFSTQTLNASANLCSGSESKTDRKSVV